jgi:hypothetical protein
VLFGGAPGLDSLSPAPCGAGPHHGDDRHPHSTGCHGDPGGGRPRHPHATRCAHGQQRHGYRPPATWGQVRLPGTDGHERRGGGWVTLTLML